MGIGTVGTAAIQSSGATAGLVIRLVSGGVSFGTIFQSMFPDAPQEQLAMFHTIFNVITVILILPLTDALVQLNARNYL